ncbi:MAG: ribosome small subunit-dependent GTPase A [Gammaproteobacteria bacterium RIFCSPHIGHO2_12_FULL_43_28]|nr:MAG: ribosome small subunit-dependent GTPase A [Gammaproteobacteria bacterium RIFCSPHIGHO2_12_FULL_43_28]
MHNVNENNHTGNRRGLVISYFGNSVAVEAEGAVYQCHLRRNQELPVVGDEVIWREEGQESYIVVSILPRRSLLTRGDSRKKAKPIAANLDALVIVMAPPPIFSAYLVDRYVAAAELLSIQPIIVLNKTDLMNEAAQKAADALLDSYRAVPYPVVLSSIYRPLSLNDLTAVLAQKTAVLVGPSGVGKSSIIASLSEEAIRVGTVSEKGAGKHTTTATRLYHLPGGGRLIDSPGVREFTLWTVTKEEALKSFKEFTPYTSACKFRDCQHLAEPDCAVKKAVQLGKISAKRYESYQLLMKEAEKKR